MNYIEFMKVLMNKKLKGIYLFECEEDFLKDNIIENIKDELNLVEFNYIKFSTNVEYSDLKSAFETYPIMDEKKYIIIDDLELTKNKLKDYKFLDNLKNDVDDFPDYSILLIFSKSQIFKGAFYKKILKQNNLVEIKRLNDEQLLNFIGKRFVRNGKKISKSLIREIIERFSYLGKDSKLSLYDISNTVDKIIANSTEKKVSEDDVYKQLDKIINMNIFNLMDALSQRDIKKSMDAYFNLLDNNEDIFMIYHMILRQVRNLIAVKSVSKFRHNLSYCLKITKLSKFEYTKLTKFANNFSIDELIKIHSHIFKMDKSMKSEKFNMNIEMELLIGKFA